MIGGVSSSITTFAVGPFGHVGLHLGRRLLLDVHVSVHNFSENRFTNSELNCQVVVAKKWRGLIGHFDIERSQFVILVFAGVSNATSNEWQA